MSRITVLVENTATGLGLLSEHGLSFWIEHGGQRILFDTGQGYVLKNNARRLNVSIESADALVLSHGHYDHTGGLKGVLELGGSFQIFLHPVALAPRYARLPDGTSREIGMPQSCIEAVHPSPRLTYTEAPTEVRSGVYVTGPVPRQTDFEDAGGPFFADPACRQPDEFPDDQALYFDTPRGTVVVLGCAHAGIVNTLRYVQVLTKNRPVHAVIGGTHLVAASPERMDKTVEELRRIDMQRLMPAHCTGFPAMARLWQEFPCQYAPCPTGTVIE
ncbi:MAG TPA: MBL fold metallo-hydrolase, partial [Candidatus Hydrogenedentes bacterium]|nr:MBL fold metallo-hydrolase [Candidatus Hydrogenedentota bacterium]